VSDVVRARCLVSGRVQGVFFRAATAQEAAARGVRGWARNLPDGSVEVVFEGARSAVDEMIRWCHSGPPMASVDEVQVVWEEARGDAAFSIRD
jgi:acylphosphatase